MILHNIYSCASNKLDNISDIKILNKKYYIIVSNYIHLISSDDFKCVKCIERFSYYRLFILEHLNKVIFYCYHSLRIYDFINKDL